MLETYYFMVYVEKIREFILISGFKHFTSLVTELECLKICNLNTRLAKGTDTLLCQEK